MTDELVADRLYRLDLGRVNAYLVDTGETTLIDAGTPNAVDDLRSELDDAGYDTVDIDRVLITHFDLDHVGTLAHIEFDGPIYALEPDASFLDGSRKPPLSNHKGLLQRLTDVWLTRPSIPVQRLSDGESVAGFDAHHAPGHTPGHTVYFHDTLDVAFLGDLVAEEDGSLTTAPWILTYSTSENAASVRALADSGRSFDIATMGHGTPLTENGREALAELARQFQ
ncbi:MAG: MBL fold metallo-hydrolase [Halobacteriales archaeon]